MQKQAFNNHRKFYATHHFVFYPIMSVLFGVSAYYAYTTAEKLIWTFISLLFLAVIWLSYMLRQHYALKLQDRIIRMELRYRYFTLTGNHFDAIEAKLRDSQLFALRFCSDEELPGMVRRALDENLSGSKIKQAILDWKGDHERV
ncbi:DUF6526 family protein [Flavobacterium sp. 3HN19-14]|uniref:DUF6526 family protein n=1 Tax=Flavobacterium sp. 3HN19-14 TaxID=3448133 RepID=UPI003EE1741C